MNEGDALKRVVVDTFSPIVQYFEIQYEDNGGEWCNAAGPWSDQFVKVNIRSMYERRDEASAAARELMIVSGFKTRVVRVEGGE